MIRQIFFSVEGFAGGHLRGDLPQQNAAGDHVQATVPCVEIDHYQEAFCCGAEFVSVIR
jgi:hypothetical protein